MAGIEERLANWGRVMRRQRGSRASLIWDGYWRAKAWDSPLGIVSHGTDPEDAWEVERAWADRRLGPIARVTLSLHYVQQADPRKACRIIHSMYSVHMRPSLWEAYVAGAQVAIEAVLELRERNNADGIGLQSFDIPQFACYKP